MNSFDFAEMESAYNAGAMRAFEGESLDVDREVDRVADWLGTTDEGFMTFMDMAFNNDTFTEGLDQVLRSTQDAPTRTEERFAAIGRALCALIDDEINRIANDDWEKISEWVEE